MTPPKGTAAKSKTYSYGDFGALNGDLHGKSKAGSKKPAAKPAPKKSKDPVASNEDSRSGIIFLQGFMLTDRERGRALAAGKKSAPWSPAVGSAYVRGTYTPKGVKPLRPADDAVPIRATGAASRPAGKGHAAKPFHIPKLTTSIFPRETPAPAKTLSAGMSYSLGKGNFDSSYFTDAADLK